MTAAHHGAQEPLNLSGADAKNDKISPSLVKSSRVTVS
jgi:hypothetical protein